MDFFKSNQKNSTNKGTYIQRFPVVLCIHDPHYRDQFLAALNAVDNNSYILEKITLDFSNIEKITASGAVALFSQITHSQLNSKKFDLFDIKLPANPKTRNLFRASGLFATLKPGGPKKLDKLWSSENLFKSGYDPDKHLEPTILDLQAQLKLPYRLKEAIGEAYLNIIQHAYPDYYAEKRWWQYSKLDRDEKRFKFIICDKGMTIKKSFNNKWSCVDSIVNAMKEGVSSTGDAWRGKGSENLKKPVESDERDELVIVSGEGLYRYTLKQIEPETSRLYHPFNGTLIAWNFVL